MTREEEERRLALSTAIAQINAAHDALDAIDWSRLPLASHDFLSAARRNMTDAGNVAQINLDALKKKAIDEEREATK